MAFDVVNYICIPIFVTISPQAWDEDLEPLVETDIFLEQTTLSLIL